MPTITDIAKASGVSTATVSYVLNGRSRGVSDQTRQSVLRVMRDLNYQPSPLFMRKHVRHAEAVGIAFLPGGDCPLASHPYFSCIIDGVLTTLGKIDWDLILFTAVSWTDLRKSLRAKCDGRCDGLILISLSVNETLIEVLRERAMPFVCVNMAGKIPGISSVDVDNIAASRYATQHLIDLGHRRIGMLSGTAISDDSVERELGYHQALTDAGLSIMPELEVSREFNRHAGHEAALKLLRMRAEERPTAILCGSDQIAFGAYQAAQELGLRIPEDLSVVGFDDIPLAATCDPPLTTVRQPLAQIGKRAANILLSQIKDSVPRGEKAILPTELILRGSTAAPVNSVN